MIWTLHIKLLSGRWAEKDWSATIALDASSTLDDLHSIILQAVGFDDDHPYGFFVARTPRSRDRVRYDCDYDCYHYFDDEDDDEDNDGDGDGDEDEHEDQDQAEDVDVDEDEDEDDGVFTTTVESLFPLPNDRKLFYQFDYGDDWIFQISRTRSKPFAAEPGVDYPHLIDERGEKPEQYPAFD